MQVFKNAKVCFIAHFQVLVEKLESKTKEAGILVLLGGGLVTKKVHVYPNKLSYSKKKKKKLNYVINCYTYILRTYYGLRIYKLWMHSNKGTS